MNDSNGPNGNKFPGPSFKTEQQVADIAAATLDAMKAAGGLGHFDRMRVIGHMLNTLTDGEGIGTISYQASLGVYLALKLEPLIPAVRAFHAYLVAGGYSSARPLELSRGAAAEKVYIPHGDYAYPVVDSEQLKGFVMTPMSPEMNYVVVVDETSAERDAPRMHFRQFWNNLSENIEGDTYTGQVFGEQTVFSREDVIRLADKASWYSNYSGKLGDHPDRPSLQYFEHQSFQLRTTNSGYLASTMGKNNPDGHEVEAPADIPQARLLRLLHNFEETLRTYVPQACPEEHPYSRAATPRPGC